MTHDPYGVEATSTDRTGLLIIRAWIEPASADPLRAQLRVSTDVSAGIQRSLTLSTPHEVLATVAVWLEEILSDEALRLN